MGQDDGDVSDGMISVTPSDRKLLEIQIDALFTHDANGRIVAINEPDGEPAPRFFLGRTTSGNLWRIRHDVPTETARRLAELAAAEPVTDDLRAEPEQLAAFQDVLRHNGAEPAIDAGPAYKFPAELPKPTGVVHITRANLYLLRRMAPYLEDIRPEREPCVAMIADGAAVSLCFSARLTEQAAESGVETLAEYRGRGYAPAVVAAWAAAVRASSRIPLYSTSWGNHASHAVARKLGLILYAADFSLA